MAAHNARSRSTTSFRILGLFAAALLWGTALCGQNGPDREVRRASPAEPGLARKTPAAVSPKTVPSGATSKPASPSTKSNPPLSAASASQRARVVESLGKFPMRFEANQGQTDERVEFLSRGQGYTLFLTGEEAVLSLVAPSADGNSKLETGKSKSEKRKAKNAGEPDIQNPKSSSPESRTPAVLGTRLMGRMARRTDPEQIRWPASNSTGGSHGA